MTLPFKDNIFIKDGYTCYLKRDMHEPIEYFLERGNFVVSQKPCSEKSYNELVLYSRLLINIKYSGAIYDKAIMEKINLMSNGCYVS